MSRLSKDAKMMIVIFALALFAGYYFLIRPQGADIAQARADRAAAEQSVTDLQGLLQGEDGEAGGAEASDAVADVDELAVAVPPDAELSDLLRQLDAIADASGMIHSSISPSPVGPNPLGPGGSIQIAISATGSHGAALAYLGELMSMPRLALIEQVGLHGQPGGDEAQLTVSARVFTVAAPVAAP